MANLLSELLLQRVREQQCFSRVVSFKEIEEAVNLEQQRQMLLQDCDSSSCLAEIAGAIGVDYLLIGSVGRVGDMALLTLKLVAARSGEARASVAEQVPWHDGKGVFEAVPNLLRQLLRNGGFQAPDVTPPRAAPPVAQAPAWKRPLLGVGAAALGGGGGVLVLGVACALTAVLVVAVPVMVPVPAPGLTLDGKKTLLLGTGGLLVGAGAVATLLSLLLAAAGVAGLVLGGFASG